MASEKEIRAQIASIRNTQTITQAMKMVAASKMAKTQISMQAGRPYASAIHSVIGHITQGNLSYQHPYLETRIVKQVGYLVVSTDRGLCGGLNNNLFKAILADIHHWVEQGVAVELALIGAKAISFFGNLTIPILGQISGTGDKPALSDMIGIVNLTLTAYDQQKWDRLYLGYNKFVSAIQQRVQIEQLLPLPKFTTDNVPADNWDYLYEPDPEFLLSTLLSRFIESQVYQGVVENLACEQAARRVAMQSATDNASELLRERQSLYNKKRQASITQELSEIIAGATAV